MNNNEEKIEFDKNNLFKNIRTIEEFEKAMKNEEFRKEYLKNMEDDETSKKEDFVR